MPTISARSYVASTIAASSFASGSGSDNNANPLEGGMTNPGPLVFRMDSALLLFVTDKYNVRPNVYATPGRAAAAAALAMVE